MAGFIVGFVIGGLSVVAALIVTVWFYETRHRNPWRR